MATAENEGAESALTVAIAFGVNVAVAVAKTLAAWLTGSASMVAEAAHSWADAGNEVFLVIAERRGRRPPDESRPLGYGREVYIWSLLAALGLFCAGGAFSIYHGIRELSSDDPGEDYLIGYVVLAFAFCLEGISFMQAYRRTRAEARELGRDTLGHALATSDPTLRAVLAEDAAALIGLVIAASGMALHQMTGDAIYDAIGSILVGVLLSVIAVILFDRNRRFLTGEPADGAVHRAAREQLEQLPGIDRVTALRLEFVGPRQIYLVARVDLTGDDPEHVAASRLRDLERMMEERPEIVDAVITLP
ncbi:cation diffusion facilitator family transporter [Nocardioides insulae]|uniref:cation diffusion facilitator family transporter n=1 Tax=Nocardioides insulae TaxID=394734 RepID=UPI0004064D6B|nr:cation diffusion facilitator family transporter [Nocardioides insulae]